MKINQLVVELDEKKYEYNFCDKTLIYSKDNSKGKTTLLRFILYAMGYSIPATEGIGDFDNINFELSISKDNECIKIYRKSNIIELIIDKKKYDFLLPLQITEMHSLIFDITNISIINNLLAVYYIDQEKGWTLLNRGKIIGNNRFNIEEFIAGISDIDITDLLDEKKVINNELKKYRYFKNVMDINSEFADDEPLIKYDMNSMDELLQEQKNIEMDLKKIKNNRKKIQEVISNNKQFADMIENYGLIINHNGEEFTLTKSNLGDFDGNQKLLRIRDNMYKIEEDKLLIKYKALLKIINEKNTLFSMDDIITSMEKTIEKSGVDVSQIDKIIKQMTNKRNNVNQEIKDKLSFNNSQLNRFYEIIIDYAKELGIYEFVSDKDPKFVLTNKLKGLSGRVLAQMAFIFKLSYIKVIKEKYNIILPIIIDSPRTNELSETSTNDMIKILNRDFDNHQIIMASIYDISIIDFNILDLNDGLLSDNYKKS